MGTFKLRPIFGLFYNRRMSEKINTYEAYIFDLGGVIINLDIGRTIKQLANHAGLDPETMVELYWGDTLFHAYERGEVTDTDFRNGIRDLLKVSLSDQQIDEAWNAMILDIPRERLNLLYQLKAESPIFLLSNTNNIHLKKVNEAFEPAHYQSLDDYFVEAYYSHQVGMRKPGAVIYEKVLEDHQLDPSKTLFLDDNLDNLKGAQAVGLQTYQVTNPNLLKEIFDAEKI